MSEEASPKVRRIFLWGALIFVLVLGSYTQLTLFVVQPIGAVPEGRTLVLRRTGNLKLIDSADAFCEREGGGVSLLCRGVILGDAPARGSVGRSVY